MTKGFAYGTIYGFTSCIIIASLILFAYLERGYWAVGGEWLMILVGIPSMGYCLNQSLKKQKSRKERAHEVNQKRKEEYNRKHGLRDIELEALSKETVKDIEKILKTGG